MPRHRRLYQYNGVYFVTNRTSHGLPLVANLYFNMLLLGILARAMFLYPGILVCAWLFMGNHYHGVVVLKADADQMQRFMKYVDAEIAKAINRLRGVSNQNVWASRYNAVALLTPETVIEKIVYIYLNPVKAHLVERISQYPGASTWKELTQKQQRSFKFIGSATLTRLPQGKMSMKFIRLLVKGINELHRVKLPLRISPVAWLDCFAESTQWRVDEVYERILRDISTEEDRYIHQRAKHGIEVLGEKALMRQNFYQRYRSKRYGKRAICASNCNFARKQYIRYYRQFCETCRAVWEKWLKGQAIESYPPGAFRPPRAPAASLFDSII
jgi:REP element-mobilizing transposase RayT